MTPEKRFVLEVQTRAWLDAMRRARISRYGAEVTPLPAWEDLTIADRNVLMTAMQAGINAGRPESVERARERLQQT